jgi:hypothetical protein
MQRASSRRKIKFSQILYALLAALALGVLAAGCTLFNSAPRPPIGVRIECATAAVVGLRWSAADASKSARYEILRNGASIGKTADLSFDDASVSASQNYSYVISAFDAQGNRAASAPVDVSTPPESGRAEAPYCASSLIRSMTWDWAGGYRAAEGSDLWPVTWGQDGNVYTFFGDGGGFGGDDHRGRTSFGIAMLTARPPLNPAAEINLYGGYLPRYPSHLSGKARALIAVGSNFYAIAGLYRSSDAKSSAPQPISGSPEHVEMVYSPHDAHSWRDSGWTFCSSDTGAAFAGDGAFCPSGFINFGAGNAGARDRYVYLMGTSPASDRAAGMETAARTYLARVARTRILQRDAYRYFAGLDSGLKPVWSADPARMQPIFTDRSAQRPGCGGQCSMSSNLEEAVYDAPLQRFIGVAQGNLLAQTSFYESVNPWGPWATISYHNIDAADGSGGWGNLGSAAGESLGVHPVNAWTSADGRTLWMVYSSDGRAGPDALFPPPGTKLDAFHLLRVELDVAQAR